jgi:hypothetical protein
MEMPELPESPSDDNLDTDREKTMSDKRSFYQQLQVVTTFVTLIVAVSAIGLSVWEGYETRLNNRLSVQPFLEGTKRILTNDSTYNYEAYVTSDGLGPAVYEKVMIYDLTTDPESGPVASSTDDEPMISLHDAPDLRERWTRTEIPQRGFFGYLRQGAMQRPGSEETFFHFSVSESEVNSDSELSPNRRVSDLLNTYSVVVCYCSVYGDSCRQMDILGPAPSDDICTDLGYDE